MPPAWHVSVYLHLVAMAVWVGGMVAVAVVMITTARTPAWRALAPDLVETLGRRWQWVGWSTLAVLFVTGFANMIFRYTHAAVHTGEFWKSAVGIVLAHKIALFLLIVGLQLAHDLRWGPRAIALWRTDPEGAETRRLRRRASFVGRANLALSLLVMGLGVWLVRPW